MMESFHAVSTWKNKIWPEILSKFEWNEMQSSHRLNDLRFVWIFKVFQTSYKSEWVLVYPLKTICGANKTLEQNFLLKNVLNWANRPIKSREFANIRAKESDLLLYGCIVLSIVSA